jgi:hypothetical protein
MKPTGDSAQLEWSVRWSRNRQAPTHAVSQVRFSAEALDGLHAAAEAMRSQSQSIGYEVVGYVAKLSRAAGHSPGPGEVVVVPTGADATELGRVAVRLEPADYDRAIQAHQAGRLIRLVGTLKKASRRWGLEGVVAVETLPDDGADA